MDYTLFIPVVVPLVIAGIKWAMPYVPKVALPILAPVLGAILDIIGYYSGLADWSPGMGAILGAVGVTVREALDQAKKALAG